MLFRATPMQGLVARLLEIVHVDAVLALAPGKEGRLVHEVGKVRAGRAGGGARQARQVHVVRQGELPCVQPEDELALLDVRHVDDHLPVETTRPQQRGVQDVRPVGGGKDDHAVLGVETVHFHQHLVEGLLPLVMTTAVAGAAGAADGVKLVDEENARRVPPSLLEQVPHAAGAHAHEHLDEIRARHVEESDIRLPGDGLGEKCLAGPGHADQEDSLGDLGAETGELLRALQELDDLLQLILGLVLPRHVGKGDAAAGIQVAFRPALAEGERLVAVALDLAEHEPDEEEPDHPRQELDHHRERGNGLRAARDLDPLVLERLQELRVAVGNDRLEEGQLTGLALEGPLDLVLVDDLDGIDLPFRQVGLEGRVGELGSPGTVIVDEEEYKERYENEQGDESYPVVEIEPRDPGNPVPCFRRYRCCCSRASSMSLTISTSMRSTPPELSERAPARARVR